MTVPKINNYMQILILAAASKPKMPQNLFQLPVKYEDWITSHLLYYSKISFITMLGTIYPSLDMSQMQQRLLILIYWCDSLRIATSGVSRNLMMCMHILETTNSIVYRAQSQCVGGGWWWFEVGGLILVRYLNGKMSIFYKHADFKQHGNFFPEKLL